MSVGRQALPRSRRAPVGGTHHRPPAWLLLFAGAVALIAALPLVYLALTIAGAWPVVIETVLEPRSLALLARSIGLAAAVTLTATLIAVPSAWLTTRTDLPFRGLWTVLLALPLVIPSYIGAYLLVSALGPSGLLQEALGVDRLPSIYGFPGAWIVLSLCTYPLILLTVRSALRRLDPQLEDAARGMGRSQARTFFGIVLPQLLPAIGAGALLVALYVLSDFGAVSIVRFDSFTRAIYVAYQSSFDRTIAAALAGLLVLVMLALLAVEARLRSGRAYHRTGPGSQRGGTRVALGRWRWPALAFCWLVVVLALVLPIGVLVYWSLRSFAGTTDWALVGQAAFNSLLTAGLAAGLAAICALGIAALTVRHPSRIGTAFDRVAHTGYALPGIVVALALVFFATRVALPLYQTLGLLVVALVILFLPQAIGATRTALLQISPRLEEAARGLGRGQLRTMASVTAPL
ncbi:MAG: iron ABC transporter permease, partial [Thermoleophilaceae bacterium]|nr:iron ABC transporter permease [Thermoleophilaceae bacterium]